MLMFCRDLKDRHVEAVKEFPASLAYNPADFADPDSNVNMIFARILLQLEQLQNLFLIERMLSKHGEVDEGGILLIAFKLVSLTLLFWTHKDRFAPFRNDFEWLVRQTIPPLSITIIPSKTYFTYTQLCGASRSWPLQLPAAASFAWSSSTLHSREATRRTPR